MWWFYVLLFIALWIWWKLTKDPRRDFNPWPRQFVAAHLKTSYDFIVVGAGSSGCVLASRLAQGISLYPKIFIDKLTTSLDSSYVCVK
jgi:hypothetical protein